MFSFFNQGFWDQVFEKTCGKLPDVSRYQISVHNKEVKYMFIVKQQNQT